MAGLAEAELGATVEGSEEVTERAGSDLRGVECLDFVLCARGPLEGFGQGRSVI